MGYGAWGPKPSSTGKLKGASKDDPRTALADTKFVSQASKSEKAELTAVFSK